MAFLVVLAVLAGLALANDAQGSHTGSARPVTRAEARFGATFEALLPRGGVVTVERQCPRGTFFSETSAYHADGGAMRGQRWNRDHTRAYWRSYRRGYVVHDGVTFWNRTNHAVRVAGWCH